MDKIKLPPFEDGGLWLQSLYPEENWRHFRVGTCTGLYRAFNNAYEILAIENSKPGNGHVEAVLEWFYKSCRRDNYTFIIREVWNDNLRNKLIANGFILKERYDYIKTF